MSVTIKKIAELCGVSRGTVDRVINHRGKVKPETQAKVMRVVRQLSYTPDLAGKSLAIKKKRYEIGVLLPSEGNAFFEEVIRGVEAARQKLETYDIQVILKTMKGYQVKQQLQLIEELEKSIQALIITPINHPLIAEKLGHLMDGGICVITMNNDIEGSKRLCYVGSDYRKGGETACGMLGILTGGSAKIGIVAGSRSVLGHQQRLDGFLGMKKERYPGFEIIDTIYTDDDEIESYDATTVMLREHPEMTAIFIVAGGVYGACRAIMARGLAGKMKVVTFDKTPSTEELIKSGVIQATICQQPYSQGNVSIQKAFNYLVSGEKPKSDCHYMKNEIRIFENL